ncbi:MAG: D-amino-acid transaminase [Hyphomicrobiaceae bacterium]|nr:D-amino-acid transaminase [Hyphomicrobiaceae bacterium]
MARFVFVDGRYVRHAQAAVHVEDRGFQFADAVYEVIEVRAGRLVDKTRHLDRLEASLMSLAIPSPMTRAALSTVIARVVVLNRVRDGMVYLQVSRGVARRDFLLPPADTPPTVVCLARSGDLAQRRLAQETGVAVITSPDIRWGRCDIKTTMLLPGSLAKDKARQSGAKEAWLVDRDGFVTEGASSTAWIVDAEGRLVTRPLGPDILPGVTRRTMLDVAAAEGIAVIERAFTPDEAARAREAFYTAASSILMPVVSVDGRSVGNGRPGSMSRRLLARFHSIAEIDGR